MFSSISLLQGDRDFFAFFLNRDEIEVSKWFLNVDFRHRKIPYRNGYRFRIAIGMSIIFQVSSQKIAALVSLAPSVWLHCAQSEVSY